ncbi:hypothetical protein GWO43_14220, partial [candidate division KSB1 bacterium]|nr:hypothetical protein [candidate division KSB1 bacterium]NIV70491.1 hypothetical protein [Phycisphaerae bacterium]NIS25080.1 hypothetical protein [candidate division KSB1 bacterium]NIT71999.1 hypothetical protein [candidate division KSB1 bacterium]NIU25122.1 hypothetical protein [candidate division KSB1 bacterium]
MTEARAALAREYAALKEKTFGIFGSEQVEDVERAQEVANLEHAYRESLKEYRQWALEEHNPQKAQELIDKTVAGEAT